MSSESMTAESIGAPSLTDHETAPRPRGTERILVELWTLAREPWLVQLEALLALVMMGSLTTLVGPALPVGAALLALRTAPRGAAATAALLLVPGSLPVGLAVVIATTCVLLSLAVPVIFADRVRRDRIDNHGWPRLLRVVGLAGIAAPFRVELALASLGMSPRVRAQLDALDLELKGRRVSLPWANWGKTAACVPDLSLRPTTLAELRDAVREGVAAGRRIRAVASGYSWSRLCVTDDLLIYCERLDRVTMDLSDPEHPRVVAEVGATNRQINDVLERAGYALESNAVLEVVRIGGLVATGSHGSGIECPTVSDYVHAVEMVMSDGSVRRFEADTDGDVMDAVRLSLGAFGVMWRLTLDIVPLRTVRLHDELLPIDETMATLDERVRSVDALDLFLFPGCDKFVVKTHQAVDAPAERSPRHSRWDALRSAFDMEAYRVLALGVRLWPRLTPLLGRMTQRLGAPAGDRLVPLTEAVHYRRHVDAIRLVNIEIAFKTGDDFAAVREAYRAFERITKSWEAKGRYPLTMVFNARFIHRSTALLSPAAGPGHTCYVEVLSFRGTPGWQEYTSELAEAWLKLPGAVPHWAKQWEHLPGVDAAIQRRYGARLRRFAAIQRELDPGDHFRNRLVDRVLALALAEGSEADAARSSIEGV